MKTTDTAWQMRVKTGAEKLGVPLSENQLSLFSVYARELLAWNAKCNLTAIKDPMEVAEKHMVDAVAVSPYFESGSRILDIGAGGGFPGIPASIVDPTLSVTMVDAVRKKISFLKHVARTLKLKGAEAVHARAEELSKDEDRFQSYDVVTSRAFAAIDTFVTMALPYLKPGGRIIAMKGKEHEEDAKVLEGCVSALAEEGIEVSIEVVPYALPFSGSTRALFIVTLLNHSH